MAYSGQGRVISTAQSRGTLDSMRFLRERDIVSSETFLSQGYVMAQAEKRLMFAVLLDAVECYKKFAPRRRNRPDRLYKDAREWIFENDRKWPFSFINVCEAVGLSPQYLRQNLEQWERAALREDATRWSPRVLNGPRHRPASLARAHPMVG
jgi:hypothetical protein